MKSKVKQLDHPNNVSTDSTTPFLSQLTAAELMRQKLRGGEKDATKPSDTNETRNDIDIDEEIKRLEAELAADASSNSSQKSSDDDSILDESDDDSEIREKEQSPPTGGVLCLSACAGEKIAPLPKNALPTVKSKKLKIDSKDDGIKKETRKRKKSKTGKERSNSTEHVVSDGLIAAVKDVLSGYVARSSEKIPFYCRVCSHQSKSEEEFREHKGSDFHKAAVQVERKATYCKLCRKQLTSIVQMQEHLASRPHREKMNSVKTRQRGGSAGHGRPNDGLSDYTGRSRQTDKRKWT
mmetsp:Transcript_5162/g.9819  ORF Transcript_5162/g.9819 Transcript_5162/m.9819 type:complete len:295 (+) Transcript_5162:67-951(+)